jgi:hypothetical protein
VAVLQISWNCFFSQRLAKWEARERRKAAYYEKICDEEEREKTEAVRKNFLFVWLKIRI